MTKYEVAQHPITLYTSPDTFLHVPSCLSACRVNSYTVSAYLRAGICRAFTGIPKKQKSPHQGAYFIIKT